jgi:hypothetical protein
LTFSRDWDIAITTDGEVNKNEKDNNIGIIDFLHYLKSKSGTAIPDVFFKELPKVVFDVPDGFSEIAFHPIGNFKKNYPNPITTKTEKQDERLVVSPFLDKTTLDYFVKTSKRFSLFSTDFELSSLPEIVLSTLSEKYRFNPFIEDAESLDELSEPDEIPFRQNLHAKFFIDKKGRAISWYIGSANASKPASERNIEFMVELKTSGSAMSPKNIKNKLISTNNSSIILFEAFEGNGIEITESEKIKAQELRRIIHEISGVSFTGKAILNEFGRYDLEINIPLMDVKLPSGIIIKIKPLPENKIQSIEINLAIEQRINDFKNYDETLLSPFLIVEIYKDLEIEKRFVVDMKIDLEPSRLNKIFSSIINDRSRFLNYLSFLLSEETPDKLEDNNQKNNKKKENGMEGSIAFFDGTPIYEKLMITSSRNPSRLSKISNLIERLKGEKETNGNDIISKEFYELWSVFKPAENLNNGS